MPMPNTNSSTDFFAVGPVTDYVNHRAPFLFIDGAQVNAEMSEARSMRRFRSDEWFFNGHFPEEPIVPGVILLELAAQTANLLLSRRAKRVAHAYLVNADAVSFKSPVRPGDQVSAGVSFARIPDRDADLKPGGFFFFRTSVLHDNRPCMRAQLSVFWAK